GVGLVGEVDGGHGVDEPAEQDAAAVDGVVDADAYGAAGGEGERAGRVRGVGVGPAGGVVDDDGGGAGDEPVDGGLSPVFAAGRHRVAGDVQPLRLHPGPHRRRIIPAGDVPHGTGERPRVTDTQLDDGTD